MAKDTRDDDKDPNGKEKGTMTKTKTSPWAWGAMALLIVITYVTMPDPLQPPHGQSPSRQHVFYYGWLTAVFTGLGALPLAFAPNLASYWVGLSNGTFVRSVGRSATMPKCCIVSFCLLLSLVDCAMRRFASFIYQNY